VIRYPFYLYFTCLSVQMAMAGGSSTVKALAENVKKVGTTENPLDVDDFDNEEFVRAREMVGRLLDEELEEENSDSESLGSQDSIVVKSEPEDEEPYTPHAPQPDEFSMSSDEQDEEPMAPKKRGRPAVLSLEHFFIRNGCDDAMARDMCNAHLSVIRARQGNGKAAKASKKAKNTKKE